MTEKEKPDNPRHMTAYQPESQTLPSDLLMHPHITLQINTKEKENQYMCLTHHHQAEAIELQFPEMGATNYSHCFSIYISSICIV